MRDPFNFASRLCSVECLAIGSLNNIPFAVLEFDQKIMTLRVGDMFCECTLISIDQNYVTLQDKENTKINIYLKTLQLK